MMIYHEDRTYTRTAFARLARASAWLVALCAIAATTAARAEEPLVSKSTETTQSLEIFKSSVRPLLTAQCVKCHGGEKAEGEFDLTTREGLLAGGAQGPAVVVGKPQESLLVRLVLHEGEPGMPAEGAKLPQTAIDHIVTWIATGAEYDGPLVDTATAFISKRVDPEAKQFWSFQPLSRPQVPSVRGEDWCRTNVDQFVLSALEAKGLEPNGLADRRKLIRRAHLDLTGLPPSAAEVEAFVADPDPQAYSRLVDRLLTSPHYGERWGRHWLDLARFAESHGYEQDYDRPSAYHYRDFVIQALNADMPFTDFVRLQIAGDEIDPDNRLALMATGFLGAGTHATQITANQVEKERYDELDDMAATVGTSMLGLTIGCARCHDHKYDPIPQADYYRLVSTFTTAVRSEMELDFHPERYQAAKTTFDRDHAPLAEALAKFERDELPGRFEKWLADATPVAPKWLIVEAQSQKSDAGAKFERQEDGSYLARDKNADTDVYTFIVETRQPNIMAVRLDALADESLPKGGPGRAANGNFALSDFQLWGAQIGSPQPGAPIKLVAPKATFEQEGLPITAAVDDNKSTAWAIDPEVGKDHAACFEFEGPLKNDKGTKLTFILKFESNKTLNLGRLRLSVTSAAKPVALDGDLAPEAQVEQVNQALKTPAGDRTKEQRGALLAWYRTHDADWQRLSAAVQNHLKQAPKPELTKVMVTTEGLPAIRLHTQGADFFENTFYLKRGDLNQKIAPAEQSFLQVLMDTPEGGQHWKHAPPEGSRTSYRRRALADWLTDAQHGAGDLLARVIVNRLWQHHLGRGIVATPSDFGASGARPTHPELLDYLAGQLIDSGWRLKDMHRLIMTSAVYMQSAEIDTTRANLDPENLLLWHRNRTRLEAEAIRDAMLAVSGQLNERMYGPGTLEPGHHRRSIYFTVKRSQLVPSMMLFDAPDSLQGLGARAATIVAPQALAMLNSPQVQELSRALAQRVWSADRPVEQAIVRGFGEALGRAPDAEELADAVAFFSAQRASYETTGNHEAAELAMADFCQVLFGLSEFIYID